jgi:15,16-dihydrobiliverdin:ferredoxin oxidoreductase
LGVTAHAYSSSFLGRQSPVVFGSRAPMRMDSEKFDLNLNVDLDQIIQENTRPRMTIDQAEAVHGMPWTKSIDPSAFQGEDLLYMPFWQWQTNFMKETLTDLRMLSCHSGQHDFGYNENLKKKARIVNLCATSKEYRKIRLTYYDAGDNCQVFNAVFYPDPKYNLPVLGIDLLAFNRKKYLAIVDFQPIHQEEEKHACTFEHLLAPIKSKYDSLKGQMSSKFYDETQFFSKQMLFSRFENENVITDELFPAFTKYVETHLRLIRDTPANEATVEQVLERQQAYDTYSAERDPAAGLFCAMFGAEWADDYIHNFLFSLAERKQDGKASAPAMPFMGGPPQQASARPQPQREAAVAQR